MSGSWDYKEEKRKIRETRKLFKEECKRLKKEKLLKPGFFIKRLIVTGIVCSVIGGILSSVVTLAFIVGSLKIFKKDFLSLKPEKIIEQNYVAEIKEYEYRGAAVYDKVSPSIVGIKANNTLKSSIWEPRSNNEATGVIYSEDGYIITNFGVIQNVLLANGTLNPQAYIEVYVNLDDEVYDNNIYNASIVGYDAGIDIALLKINTNRLHKVTLTDSKNVLVGGDIFVFGCNSGIKSDNIGIAINNGIICDINSEMYNDQLGTVKLIQVNTELNTGTLGGVIVDGQGNLLGMESSKALIQSGSVSNYVLPADRIAELCEYFIEHPKEKAAIIGITTIDSNNPKGVKIERVEKNSPADFAGLKKNDIIVKLNDVDIIDNDSLIEEKNKYKTGESIKFTISRNDEIKEIELTLK